MLKKVHHYHDNCLVYAEDANNSDSKFAVYQKKPNFFHRDHGHVVHTIDSSVLKRQASNTLSGAQAGLVRNAESAAETDYFLFM